MAERMFGRGVWEGRGRTRVGVRLDKLRDDYQMGSRNLSLHNWKLPQVEVGDRRDCSEEDLPLLVSRLPRPAPNVKELIRYR